MKEARQKVKKVPIRICLNNPNEFLNYKHNLLICQIILVAIIVFWFIVCWFTDDLLFRIVDIITTALFFFYEIRFFQNGGTF